MRFFIGVVLASALAHPALADLLDPLDFSSLGPLNLSGASFMIDTDALTIVNDAAPGTPLFTGVVDDQNGMASPGVIPEIAVFTFADINLASTANVTITGTRALALLSHSDVDIDTTLQLNGDGPGVDCGGGCTAEVGGPGGFAGGLGFVDGVGPGGGGGSQHNLPFEGFSGAGAGFGSMGQAGNGNLTAGAGGPIYGNLVDTLQGGSGGGGGVRTVQSTILASGGGGGGALEVGAVGTVTIGSNGVVEANGGVGNEAFTGGGPAWGGNGSGGGIRIHGATFVRLGAIRALGGTASPVGAQAAGGGGRVLVLSEVPTFVLGNPLSVSNAIQGIDVSPGITQGALAINHGAVTVSPEFTIVPSGETFELGSILVAQTASTTQPRVDLIPRSLQIIGNSEVTVPTGGYTNTFELELRSAVAKITGAGADTLTNQGELRGTGSIEATLVNDAGGEINAVNDTLTFTQVVTNNAGGQINAINSTLSFDAGLTNNGEMNLINTTILGSVVGNAASSTTLVGSNSVSGDFTMTAADALFVGLGGLLSGQFDTLSVGGDATLAGALNVSIDPGFTLSAGNSFNIVDIVDIGTTASGMFAGLDEGALVGNFGGTDLFVSYVAGDGNDVSLFTTDLPGDFDFDGDVDGGDFLAWQRGEVSDPPSASDLADWETNFGTAPGPLAAASTVPEPSSMAIALLLCGLAFSVRSHRLRGVNPLPVSRYADDR